MIRALLIIIALSMLLSISASSQPFLLLGVGGTGAGAALPNCGTGVINTTAGCPLPMLGM